MATRTATKAVAGIQPKGLRVGLVAVTSFFSNTSAQSLSVGDVIQMVKVPAGATPVYIAASVTSTIGALNFDVGDGVDTNRYLASAAASTTAGQFVINTQYVPYTYSTDDTIDIAVLSMSINASQGALYLTAIFSMDV